MPSLDQLTALREKIQFLRLLGASYVAGFSNDEIRLVSVVGIATATMRVA